MTVVAQFNVDGDPADFEHAVAAFDADALVCKKHSSCVDHSADAHTALVADRTITPDQEGESTAEE